MSERWYVLPLGAWSGLLCAGSVLVTSAVTAAVLWSSEPRVYQALSLGAIAGLLMSLVTMLAAVRLAGALRGLHQDALRRLDTPSGPVVSRSATVEVTSELAELSRVLDAMHLRVRFADELGERHRAEAQNAGAGLFELISGLVAAEEGARGQLAAELHDTVAQSLMIARGLLANKPFALADIAKLTDYVEDAEEQVRAVMARTRPPALREGDLASAVGALRIDMQARYGLQVVVEWPTSGYPMPLSGAITVYRFFQEALLNVVKHADVDDAVLCLAVQDDMWLAKVRDEGPGFEPAFVRPDRGRHVGLGLLRERARLSGGTLEVISSPGAGTTLVLRLPRLAQHVPRQPKTSPSVPASPSVSVSASVSA